MMSTFYNRIKSFKWAFKGLGYALTTQPNMRIHVVALCVAIAMGFLLHIALLEWIAVAIVSSVVLTLELLNTAGEIFLDKHYPEQDITTGRIKDLMAGAVLMAAFGAFATGLIIFLPKIIDLL